MNTRGEKKKRKSKKNVRERSTSSHDSKKFRTRSVEKQGGMAFGSRKTATAVIKPDRQTDRQIFICQRYVIIIIIIIIIIIVVSCHKLSSRYFA
jgi:t-SNARE complex subunit (syntaxin)